jgi:hypothetical protein
VILVVIIYMRLVSIDKMAGAGDASA